MSFISYIFKQKGNFSSEVVESNTHFCREAVKDYLVGRVNGDLDWRYIFSLGVIKTGVKRANLKRAKKDY